MIEAHDQFYLHNDQWDSFVNDDHLLLKVKELINRLDPVTNAGTIIGEDLLVPMQGQELWASGVTYFNSKLARQVESEQAGGGDFYENVYHADRPELFFKASAQRVVPSGGEVRIRKDSSWDVPEPELTLAVSSNGKIIGYTIGNDMSSRSIEGENPLYLPQAKTYDGCAGLGPCLYLTDQPLSPGTTIVMKVVRSGVNVFEGSVSIDQMKRKPQDLVAYLYRECSFPNGSLLMTGTGIVPTNDFTLKSGDRIDISIEPIGTLTNYVQ